MAEAPGDMIAHLVREALEGTMAPNLASAALFEALADEPDQAMPVEREAIEAFFEQRLRPALERQLGTRRAMQALDAVRELVDGVLGAAAPRGGKRPSQFPTVDVGTERGPVRVLVVATKARLANGLRNAMGKEAVEPYWAPNAEVVARILAGLLPSLVLIDGSDPRIDDASLEEVATHGLPLLVLVWSPAEPTGVVALRRLETSAHRVAALGDENAAEVLVDYVRARRAQG